MNQIKSPRMKKRLERNLRGDSDHNHHQPQQPIPQSPLTIDPIVSQVDNLDFGRLNSNFNSNNFVDDNYFGQPIDQYIMSHSQGNNSSKTFKLPPPPAKTIFSLDSYAYPSSTNNSNLPASYSMTSSNPGSFREASPSVGSMMMSMEPGDLFPSDVSTKLDTNNSFYQNVSYLDLLLFYWSICNLITLSFSRFKDIQLL